VNTLTRDELQRYLADTITEIDRPHPIRVAIDGVDGAGKTTLADELVQRVEAKKRPVIRASIDDFHRPRADRYRRGPDSPEGYYFDSFDYDALRTSLLNPLGPGGSRRYRCAIFDWRTDSPVITPDSEAPVDAVLLFDGIFCQRPELVDAWDLRIFLDVGFNETLRRMMVRDQARTTSVEEMERQHWTRYVPGQRLYLAAARPHKQAHIVIDNTDPTRPRLFGGEDPEVTVASVTGNQTENV
jgi:uridine kinase